MSIADDVTAQIKDAMKAKDAVRLSALRSMRTAFLNEMKKDGASSIADEVCEGLLRKLEKQRKESIEAFEKGDRPEMAEAFPAELARAEASVRSLFRYLEGELGDRQFVCGALSRADIALAPHLGIAAFVGCAPDETTPRLASWVEHMTGRPSVARAQGEAMEAFTTEKHLKDPLFDTARLHWRSDRIEQLLRIGLGPWLLEELAADRAFLPPVLDG